MGMQKVVVDGKVLNKRTSDMLDRAQARYGLQGANFTVVQGSYNIGRVSASAGTHDGGGVVDISVHGFNAEEIVLCMREAGFAAWHRVPSQGPWAEHIHAVAIGDPELSSSAHRQVVSYYNGKNGLASNGPDDGPRLDPIPEWYVPLTRISLQRAVRQFTTEKPTKRVATKKIQWVLNRRLDKNLLVDGVAGPKTRAAFKQYEDAIKAPRNDGVPGTVSLVVLMNGFASVVK